MKTIHINYLIFLLLFVNFNFAQTPYYRAFNLPGTQKGKSLVTVNNSLYIAGETTNTNSSNIFFSNISNNSQINWTKTYFISNKDKVCKLLYLSNCFYLIGTINSATDSSKGLIIKFNLSGDILWARQYGIEQIVSFNDAAIVDNSTLLTVGTVKDYQVDDHDIFIVKIDTLGSDILTKRLRGQGDEISSSVVIYSNTSYFVLGSTTQYDVNGDIFVLAVDNNMNYKWCMSFDNRHYDSFSHDTLSSQIGYNIIKDSYKNLLICGKNLSAIFSSTPNDCAWSPIVIKIDSTGSLKVSKSYSINTGDCGAVKILQDQNGYTFCGYQGNYITLLYKIDLLCNATWGNIYDQLGSSIQSRASDFLYQNSQYYLTGYRTSGVDTLFSLIRINSNGVGCYYSQLPYMQSNVYSPIINSIIFTDTIGVSSINIAFTTTSTTFTQINICGTTNSEYEVSNSQEMLIVYPNPVNDVLYISEKNEIKTYLYNISGRLIYVGESCEIHFDKYNQGIYFLKIIYSDKTVFFKLIKN